MQPRLEIEIVARLSAAYAAIMRSCVLMRLCAHVRMIITCAYALYVFTERSQRSYTAKASSNDSISFMLAR